MGYINKSGILEWNRANIDTVSATCGVYILRDSLRAFIYIGLSETSLRDRLLAHFNSNDIPNVVFFDWYQTSDAINARSLEQAWIARYKPTYNENLK